MMGWYVTHDNLWITNFRKVYPNPLTCTHAGVYESELERIGNVYMLRDEPPHRLFTLTAEAIMATGVVGFRCAQPQQPSSEGGWVEQQCWGAVCGHGQVGAWAPTSPDGVFGAGPNPYAQPHGPVA